MGKQEQDLKNLNTALHDLIKAILVVHDSSPNSQVAMERLRKAFGVEPEAPLPKGQRIRTLRADGEFFPAGAVGTIAIPGTTSILVEFDQDQPGVLDSTSKDPEDRSWWIDADNYALID